MAGLRFSPHLPRALRATVALVGAGCVVGCAHGKGAADRQIEELRGQIAKIQADRDRLDERVEALEAAEQQRIDQTTTAGGRGMNAAGPRLRVVRLGPDGRPTESGERATPEVDTDTDDAPRPFVRASGRLTGSVVGEGRAGEGRASDGGRGDGRLALAAAAAQDAKREYDAALSLVKAKQYDKALEALAGFLVRYPDHPNGDNAMYWRGECFYAKGEFARAADQFEGVIARFPYGNKVADALLKLGLCQVRLGAAERARETFSQLQSQYPKSEAARQVPHE